MACTRHRVFLATLVVTAKYLNDSSPKNSHWSTHSVIFNTAEINLMEKQLLCLLEYDLRFDEKEICRLVAPFMVSSVTIETPATAATRASAMNKVTQASKVRAEAQQQTQAKAQKKLSQPSAQSHILASARSAPLAGSVPSASSNTTSARTSAVRVMPVTRRLSTAHLRQPASSGSSVIYSGHNSESSSSASSSSDLGSLVDDTGSSSSSSGWTSNESDTDEARALNHNHAVSIVDPDASLANVDLNLERKDTYASVAANSNLAGPGTMKKTFFLRPSIPQLKAMTPQQTSITTSKDLHDITPTKTRKPSDTSSLHTITSPKSHHTVRGAFSGSSQNEGKRSLDKKLSISSIPIFTRKEVMSTSLTMPSIVLSGSVSAVTGSAFTPTKARLRPGTVALRPSASKQTAPRSLSPPPPLHAHSSSLSGYSATSSSSLIGAVTATKGHPSVSAATRGSGVGAIISRMWGAAAANLKGVGQRSHHPAQAQESHATMEDEMLAGHIARSDDLLFV